MNQLKEFALPEEQRGKIAVLNQDDEDSMLFVMFDVNLDKKQVLLVELDRPVDGRIEWFDFITKDVYLFDAEEVVERVTKWV